MDWIIKNKEWLFSGIGVFVIVTVYAFLKRKNKKTLPQSSSNTHNNFSNFQAGRDISVKVNTIDNDITKDK
ncbi:MAG: hypothetical protein ABIN91_09230 [Mucilaginibacter sp.]|uniref:hypothetical protein n=1 Tax=Mucilaginibacter sp. TaxID=1882438 RepID=UPI0032653E7E